MTTHPWYWRFIPFFTARLLLCVAILFSAVFCVTILVMSMGALLSTASVEEQRTKLLSSQMSDSIMANLYQIQENIRWHETPLIKLWRNEKDEEALLADMLRGEFIQEASVTLLPYKKNGITSAMMYKAVKKDSINYEFSTIKNARSIPSRIDTLTIKKIDFLEPFTNATDTLVTAVTPYYDKTGRHYAFITTTVRLYELLSCLNNMPDMGNGNVVFALSTSGVYLMHPDPKMRMNTPCSKDKKASAEFRRIFNDVRNDNKPDFNINIQWLEDFLRFEMNTAEYDGVRYVFSTFHEPYTGLTVMHGRPISVLDEEITSSISLATKFTFGMFVIAMLTLGLILRRMTRAIRSYSKASENIASGDFDTPLLIEKSYDERQILGEALENMRLSLQKNIKRIAEETAARETIEKELSIAHDIQMSMLPTKFPEAESSSKVDLYAFLRSAKEIGGDMYDFYFKGNRLYFFIGDVSGKGIPASLIMSKTITVFRTMKQKDSSDVADIVDAINKAVAYNNDNNMFVTLIVGCLDTDTGHIEFCNAGHDPMVLTRHGQEIELVPMEVNLPAGVLYDMTFEKNELTLEPGDSLLLYTDGVAEAENRKKELFTIEHLLDIMKSNPQPTSKDTIAFIESQISLYTSGAEQSDDITIMCIGYKERA